LNATAQRLWSAPYRAHSPVSILLLDIDHFKLFNDTYGHSKGDDCLIQVADILRQVVREETDTVVRFGGEEFLILAEGADAPAAYDLAHRIRSRIESAGITHTGNVPSGVITASVGIGSGVVASVGLEELIDQADSALYAAKRAGRNRICRPPDTARASA
jgi:diguanylate cyclase (GGDEF)-like protein